MKPANDFTVYDQARGEFEEFVETVSFSGDDKQREGFRFANETVRLVKILLSHGIGYEKCRRMGKPPLVELAMEIIKKNFADDQEFIVNTKVYFSKFLEPKPTSNFQVPKKTSRERQIAKMHTGVVVERGIDLITARFRDAEAEVRLPVLSTKEKWIVDCITDTVAKHKEFSPVEHSELLRFSPDEIKAICVDLEALSELPPFKLTDDDVRRITGRKDLHGWQIEELFTGVKRSQIEGSFKCFYDNGGWRSVDVYGSVVSDLAIKAAGQASRRHNIPAKHREKRLYIFKLGTICGAVIMSNLARGKFKVFPQKFYKMGLPEQELYRYYSNFMGAKEGVKLPYDAISKILGLKDADQKRRTKKIEARLEKIRAVMGIDFAKSGRGKKRVFTMKPPIERNSPPLIEKQAPV